VRLVEGLAGKILLVALPCPVVFIVVDIHRSAIERGFSMHLLIILLVCAGTVVAQDPCRDVPRLPAIGVGANSPPEATLLIGRRKVAYTIDVTEVCHFGNGGEPLGGRQ
jgi:hypothetical protein